MGVPSEEKVELVAYQLKGIVKIWYEQLVKERVQGVGQIERKEFKSAFLDRFFTLEPRKAKVQKFINLKQGNISVREYSIKFTRPSIYNPFMVADPRSRMSKFISNVSNLVSKEC